MICNALGSHVISLATAEAPRKGKREAVEDRIYREFHRAIAERRLIPGTKLVEDTLADVFSTSRARIRRVLLVLAQENLVRLEPNRGAFVCKPSADEAGQVIEARRAIELHLVREAADKANATTIKRLRKVLAAEASALARDDHERILHLSGEFHVIVAEATENRILADFLRELVSRCYLILAIYERRDNSSCPQSDHTGIVDLIEQGDADGAAEAMLVHFEHMLEALDLRAPSGERQDLYEIFRGT